MLEQQGRAFASQLLAVDALNKRYDAAVARLAAVDRAHGSAAAITKQAATRTTQLANAITRSNKETSAQQQVLQKTANEHRYVSIQLQQRLAREKELTLQMQKAIPPQQKQLTFWQSFRESMAKTFSSFSNLAQGIERTSVTVDRLTRSAVRTVNIINKISGAITGKPLLDWEKSTHRATVATSGFGASAEKTDKGIRGLINSVGAAVNPIKGISLMAVAAGTALGNLAAMGIAAVINGLRNMAFTAIQTAVNAGKSAVSIVGGFERAFKSLTALIAQEKSLGATVVETAAAITYTEKEVTSASREYEKLSIQLRAQEQAYREAAISGEYNTDQLRLAKIELEENTERYAEMGAELSKMAVAQTQAATATSATAKATGEVRDFLAASGPAAAELLRWIEKLAIESPFNVEGVKNSFLMLKSFGFMVEESKRITVALSDWSAATGKTTHDMERVSLALSQMKNLGRLAGQEVMQLAQAGISVDRILAQAMGKTTQEIVKMREDGLIPAQQAIDLIITQLEKDWKGAAKDQAETFSGLISSIEDIGPILIRNLFGPLDEATGKVGGVFGAVQPYLAKFVSFLGSEKVIGKVREFGTIAGAWVTDFLEDKIPKLQVIGQRVADFFRDTWTRGKYAFDQIAKFVGDVINVIRGVGGASDSSKGSGLFKTIVGNMPEAIKTVQTAIESIKTIVGGLVVFYNDSVLPAVDRFRTTFSITWKDVSDTTKKVLPILQTALTGISTVFIEKIMPALQTVTNFVIRNFPIWKAQAEQMFQSFLQHAQPVIDSATRLWKAFEEYIPQIKRIIEGTWADIQMVWRNATSDITGDTDLSLKSIFRIVANELDKARAWWNEHGEAVLLIVEYTLKTIVTVFGVGLNLIKGATQATLQLLSGDWRGAFATIQGMTEDNNDLIINLWRKQLIDLGILVNNAWMGIVNGIRAAVQTIRSRLYVDLIELRVRMANAWGDIYWGAVEVWGKIVAAIKWEFLKVVSDIKYNLESARQALDAAWRTIYNEADRMWRDIGYTIKDAWNNIVNWVREKVQMVADFVTNPQRRAEMIAAAASWVQGIIDKIREKTSGVYAAALDMASAALRAIRNAFGMRSPSKVGRSIGMNLGQSVVMGILDTIPMIEQAMSSVQSPSVRVPVSGRAFDRGGSVSNSKTNNFNLGVTTAASAPQVMHSFAVIQALESA